MHWSGYESGGSRSYMGGPFPWVVERNGTTDWLGQNLINLGFNVTFFALTAELLVFRFDRLNLLRKGKN